MEEKECRAIKDHDFLFVKMIRNDEGLIVKRMKCWKCQKEIIEYDPEDLWP